MSSSKKIDDHSVVLWTQKEHMENHPVQCPNCGASGCTEYRADAFVCKHCDTTFRWVNPQQITVFHRNPSCSCGKNATGCCTQCDTPVCSDHQANWYAFLGSWQRLKEAYVDGFPDLRKRVRFQGSLADYHLSRPPGWLNSSLCADGLAEIVRGEGRAWPFSAEVIQPVLQLLGFATCQEADLLCLSCVETLFVKLLRPIEFRIRQLEQQGRLCQICTRERNADTEGPWFFAMAFMATRRCFKCGAAVCGAHESTCQKCGTCWCQDHRSQEQLASCRKCAPFGILSRILG